jgi:hypothetical protein
MKIYSHVLNYARKLLTTIKKKKEESNEDETNPCKNTSAWKHIQTFPKQCP